MASLHKKVKFSLVEPADDSQTPALASFLQGSPISDEHADPPTFQMYVKSSQGTVQARKLVAESKSMVFHGSQSKKDIRNPEPFKYAIGILDKKTNSVELIPVPHMFLLEQKSKKTFSVEDDETFKDMSSMDKRSSLINLFGGKRAQSSVRNSQTNAITSENLVSSSIISGTVKMKAESDPSLIHQDGPTAPSYAPPHDASAEEPRLIYKISDLITPIEIESLDAESWTSMSEEDLLLAEKKYPKFVYDYLRAFSKIKFKIPEEKLQAFIYLAYLLSFYLFPLAKLGFEETPQVIGIPRNIWHRFTNDFVTFEQPPNGFRRAVRSSEYELKTLSYICILSLYVCDFRVPLQELAQAVKVKPTKLLSLFQSLGCRSVKNIKQRKSTGEKGDEEENEEEHEEPISRDAPVYVTLTAPLRFVGVSRMRR